MKPWLLRPYDPIRDRDCVVSHWLMSAAVSHHGRRWGAHEHESETRRAWWAAHEPVVLACLERGDTTILCAREATDSIWAFVCTEGDDAVHYVLAKRRFHRERLSEVLLRELLGDRLERPQRITHEMIELKRAGMQVPASWRLDEYMLARKVA